MKLILGTMTFGPQVHLEDSKVILNMFFDAGFKEIDTAYVYNSGDTERILGDILNSCDYDYQLATKVNPRITGKLDRKSILDQFNESMSRLNHKTVDLLYFHFPDPITPIEESLGAIAELHSQGKLKEFGLSNFPAWKVVEIYYLCKANGWPVPSVYQGMYNGLCRNVESELFPALRRLGMRFYAFNPLAGGLLTGKYKSFNEAPVKGRFTLRPNYQGRYWKKSFFDGLEILNTKCKEYNIPIVEAAYRWLAFHSDLDESLGDGIIIGASNPEQIAQNIGTLRKGKLPESIVEAFEKSWLEAQSDAPNYFRYIT